MFYNRVITLFLLLCLLSSTVLPTVTVRKDRKPLAGLSVAILVTDGFEQLEMTEPRKALNRAGAKTYLISPKTSSVKSWHHANWSESFPVDRQLEGADAKSYDALLLPGGVINPDSLRMIPDAVNFVKHFVQAGKPIAAICHGPWTLINAHGVKGHKVTSWPSLQADLENAGAHWVDKPVVTDSMLVTSRKPEDIPHFNSAMIKLFSKSVKK